MLTQTMLSLISGIFIGGIAAYLGTLMLSKKMTIVAGPLAHLAFPGVALALVLGLNISVGVFPFVIIGAILIWYLERKTKLPLENLSAIIFALGVGIGLLLLPIDKAEEALVGSITSITLAETFLTIILSVLIFFVTRYIYKKVILINIHENLAKVEGVNVDIYNLIYLLSVAIVVALSVYLVGALITVALIAIPPASAKNISSSFRLYKMWAVLFGVISAVVGIFIAQVLGLPTGPVVVLVGVVIFLFSMIFKKSS
jgi:ABC-type Mn2+/Zn2+ transport system permease subunit